MVALRLGYSCHVPRVSLRVLFTVLSNDDALTLSD